MNKFVGAPPTLLIVKENEHHQNKQQPRDHRAFAARTASSHAADTGRGDFNTNQNEKLILNLRNMKLKKTGKTVGVE